MNTVTDTDFLCRGPNQGFKIFWDIPVEVSNTLSRSLFIPIGQDISISIKPTVSETSPALLKYDPEIRQCYQNHEKKLEFFQTYTKDNCEYECLINFTLKNCGCVKFSMPHINSTKICNVTRLNCVLEAERSWLSLVDESPEDNAICKCLASCVDISFEPQFFQTDYDFERMFRSYGYDIADMPG